MGKPSNMILRVQHTGLSTVIIAYGGACNKIRSFRASLDEEDRYSTVSNGLSEQARDDDADEELRKVMRGSMAPAHAFIRDTSLRAQILWTCRPSDNLCIVYGSPHPFVLRRHTTFPHAYHLIGDAHISGLTDEDARNDIFQWPRWVQRTCIFCSRRTTGCSRHEIPCGGRSIFVCASTAGEDRNRGIGCGSYDEDGARCLFFGSG